MWGIRGFGRFGEIGGKRSLVGEVGWFGWWVRELASGRCGMVGLGSLGLRGELLFEGVVAEWLLIDWGQWQGVQQLCMDKVRAEPRRAC